MSQEPQSLEEVVEGIETLSEKSDEVCLGDALDEFGSRSFGPLLVVIPLVEISPVGGIPGLPTVLALILALIALQILIGKDHVWLPDFIQKRSMGAKKLGRFAHRLEGIAERADHLFHGRLQWLTGVWPTKVAAILIIVLCATVPPLEVVPFASSAPMLAIAAFGLALLVRDGLLMLIATLLTGGALAVAVTAMISFGGGG